VNLPFLSINILVVSPSKTEKGEVKAQSQISPVLFKCNREAGEEEEMPGGAGR
jgi:hypothetical protein